MASSPTIHSGDLFRRGQKRGLYEQVRVSGSARTATSTRASSPTAARTSSSASASSTASVSRPLGTSSLRLPTRAKRPSIIDASSSSPLLRASSLNRARSTKANITPVNVLVSSAPPLSDSAPEEVTAMSSSHLGATTATMAPASSTSTASPRPTATRNPSRSERMLRATLGMFPCSLSVLLLRCEDLTWTILFFAHPCAMTRPHARASKTERDRSASTSSQPSPSQEDPFSPAFDHPSGSTSRMASPARSEFPPFTTAATAGPSTSSPSTRRTSSSRRPATSSGVPHSQSPSHSSFFHGIPNTSYSPPESPSAASSSAAFAHSSSLHYPERVTPTSSNESSGTATISPHMLFEAGCDYDRQREEDDRTRWRAAQLQARTSVVSGSHPTADGSYPRASPRTPTRGDSRTAVDRIANTTNPSTTTSTSAFGSGSKRATPLRASHVNDSVNDAVKIITPLNINNSRADRVDAHANTHAYIPSSPSPAPGRLHRLHTSPASPSLGARGYSAGIGESRLPLTLGSTSPSHYAAPLPPASPSSIASGPGANPKTYTHSRRPSAATATASPSHSRSTSLSVSPTRRRPSSPSPPPRKNALALSLRSQSQSSSSRANSQMRPPVSSNPSSKMVEPRTPAEKTQAWVRDALLADCDTCERDDDGPSALATSSGNQSARSLSPSSSSADLTTATSSDDEDDEDEQTLVVPKHFNFAPGRRPEFATPSPTSSRHRRYVSAALPSTAASSSISSYSSSQRATTPTPRSVSVTTMSTMLTPTSSGRTATPTPSSPLARHARSQSHSHSISMARQTFNSPPYPPVPPLPSNDIIDVAFAAEPREQRISPNSTGSSNTSRFSSSSSGSSSSSSSQPTSSAASPTASKFDARRACAETRAQEGYVSFMDVTGLGGVELMDGEADSDEDGGRGRRGGQRGGDSGFVRTMSNAIGLLWGR
ncbi:hypothetical protein DL93DRAFT_2163002 [Clavulina sp. PMI_390]|nr:hypothetical protein DL93DRAFT_2163002 [Clavulina sp. PMI_390]